MSHTPGPWRAESFHTESHLDAPSGYMIFDQRSNAIAELRRAYFGNQGNLKEHAALIAAAPDLLAALEMFLVDPNHYKTYDAAKAAVAKARGQSS